MTGLEYILLHVQEPILFVIRKQHRYSINQVTPLADYYIIAGYVYQAPDLNSLISSRLASGIHNLSSAFEEAHSYMRYHPTKGYTWDFARENGDKEASKSVDKKKDKQKEETSSAFQRARVDLLLGELMKKFPPKAAQTSVDSANGKANGVIVNGTTGEESAAMSNGASETPIKSEPTDSRPPTSNGTVQNGTSTSTVANRTTSGIPEKKPRFN
jgi:mediator of RNA polymerase II transcription subunit 6